MKKMDHLRSFLFLLLASSFIHHATACGLVDATVGSRLHVNIKDIDRGIIYNHPVTSDVIGVTFRVTELNGGPYIDGYISDSTLFLTTTSAYEQYEEHETLDLITLNADFTCTGGNPSTQFYMIYVNDTNNNSPIFTQDEYEFTIAPPLLPGYKITGCENNIIVRDIDLTTSRIDFGLTGSDVFEILYDSSPEPKMFSAILRTKTFIRSLPEPIEVTISATDVDATGDPPRTTFITLVIKADADIEFPEEPVFEQPLYMATYSEENTIVLERPISLQQGYHDEVEFDLDDEYRTYFALIRDNNQISLGVISPLTEEILTRGQIYLIVRAEREFTSGATTTIVVQLPEEIELIFQRPHYEGTVEDNILDVTDLILTQGYENRLITVNTSNDLFTAVVLGNRITLSMQPLPENVIEENSFLYLEVVASTERSSASTIVTLEIIKNDSITPVFERTIYDGTYDTVRGLDIEQIELTQGYDNTVLITLDGEHSNLFSLIRNGPVSILTANNLPVEILTEENLILTVQATKPRTVGATAVITIALPTARELAFEAPSYSGTYRNGLLEVDIITLSVGYDEDVEFTISGDYASHFNTSNDQNQVTVFLSEQLPDNVIQNNFLLLTLSASGVNALEATTAILIEIIADDITTPVFTQNVYNGVYTEGRIELPNINLQQGFDNTVTFKLDGDHAQYFTHNEVDNGIVLTLTTPIPDDVIFNEKALIFSVIADKPFTVGAHAAISITFPSELTEPTVMRFSRNTYLGSLENGILSMPDIVLNTGYAIGTEFFISGDPEYVSYFTHTNEDEVVTISLPNPVPSAIIQNNKFFVLEVEARRNRAVSVFSTIIIDLIQEEEPVIIFPVFNQAYYRGSYDMDNGLHFDENVFLSQGYDETVTFSIEGEFMELFTTSNDDNNVILSANAIPGDIWDNNDQLLLTIAASKPGTIGGRAAIAIDLLKENTVTEYLAFERNSYIGSIVNEIVNLEPITLREGYTTEVEFTLHGDLRDYFSLSRDVATVTVYLEHALPEKYMLTNGIVVPEIRATTEDSMPAVIIVLEIIRNDPTTY